MNPMEKPRILIAPGPYKECLNSFEVANAMRKGVQEALPQAKILFRPMTDGGTGLTKLLTEVSGGKIERVTIMGPLGDTTESYYGILNDGKTAIVESAAAIGLSLVPKEKRNPLFTSTFGVGQLIRKAKEAGVKEIIVGCGDSSTNDAGIGCAAALGVKFFVQNSSAPLKFPTGLNLKDIVKIDSEDAARELNGIKITIACNLTSVLCGSEGTSRIYGPQKGATPEIVDVLHDGVEKFAELLYQDRKIDVAFVPGAGGSGGLAASLYALFGAQIVYSMDVLNKYINLGEYLVGTDLVLTGEGTIDDRTATGKVACGVALLAKRYDLPVVAIVGNIAQDSEDVFYNGIDAVEAISEGPITLEESIKNAPELIRRATIRVMRFYSKFSETK